MTVRPAFRFFLALLAVDVIFLALGAWKKFFFGVAMQGLVIDFVLGIFVLGQYLREHDLL